MKIATVLISTLAIAAGTLGGMELDSLSVSAAYSSDFGPYNILAPQKFKESAVSELQVAIRDITKILVERYGPIEEISFEVILVEDRKHLNDLVGKEMPSWIHAIATRTPMRIILFLPGRGRFSADQYQFHTTLMHELTHLYLYALGADIPGRGIPGWFHEGLAVANGNGMDRGFHRALARARMLGRLYRLEELITIYHTTPEFSEQAYGQAAMAVKIIAEHYGDNVIAKLFDGLRGGHTFNDAFQLATGERVEAFDRYYLRVLARRYNILVWIGEHIYLLMPILVILAYLAKKWHGWKILRRWQYEELNPDQDYRD